jgi:2-oxoglutarate ferredoxin oxidoreductase subunit alpha
MTPTGWTTVPSALKPGRQFMQGDVACAEGAIAAGCDYYAGYPITPASEIMHHICNRFSEMPGRRFMQMEDEIASIASCIGATWAGARSMTATSGPGLSLMLENIGYALITETPCVVVDVQRAGPSTGQATRPGQGDVMQARWGAHGDYEIIVLSPWSVQEMYSQTIRAFNLAQRFRVPVILLADEAVGHLRENMEVDSQTEVYRQASDGTDGPFLGPGVPPMPRFGSGNRLLITGSTHDSWGYRRTSSPNAQANLTQHLRSKILSRVDEIVETEAIHCEGRLDVLLVAYGFTARSALGAVEAARRGGMRAGLLRLKTLWPFAEAAIRELAKRSENVLVPEMNQGQVLREVQRSVPGARGYGRTDGEVIKPREIVQAMREMMP